MASLRRSQLQWIKGSTFVLDQNNSDAELGTLRRFVDFTTNVLPRVIMSSTKESDFNALAFCWNGRDGRCH